MKKENINKSCIIGMIFLVLGMNIIPITTSNSVIRQSTLPILEGDTIYVGGSGPVITQAFKLLLTMHPVEIQFLFLMIVHHILKESLLINLLI